MHLALTFFFLILLFVNRLATEPELLDELLVARFVFALEVIDQIAAVGNLTEKAVARAVILFIGLEVFGEHLNLTSEDGDLYFAGSRITVMTLEFVLDGGLVEFHFLYLSSLILQTGKRSTPPKRHLAVLEPSVQTDARGRDNLLRQSQDGAYFTKY